ncbi:MAG: hypothetical protein Q9190_000548 [Brigantiaea leucoxantha]
MNGCSPFIFPDKVHDALRTLAYLYNANDQAPPTPLAVDRTNRRSRRPTDGKKSQGTSGQSKLRQSERIQDQRGRQAAQRKSEIRRMLEDPPEKQLWREIVDGIWKWGPMSSSEAAAKSYIQSHNLDYREV